MALVKASLLLGAVLLVGAGVFGRFVAPELRVHGGARTLQRSGVLAGVFVLLVGSVLDVAQTLHTLVGHYDDVFLMEYLRFTRHGNATLLRFVLTATLAFLSLRLIDSGAYAPHRRSTTPYGANYVYVSLSLGLLATFSWTSHAAALGGAPPLLADLAHFTAASAWPGAVFYLALVPDWRSGEQRADLTKALRRVSALGLACVVLLFLTGSYTSLIHLQNPIHFAASPYGETLLYKLLLVVSIVGLAAYNRLWLLPAFLRGELICRFQNVLRLEALTLVAVFVITGVLTTSATPHEPGIQPTAFENLTTLLRYLGARLP